ncbi:response regulator [Bosea sp. (in: a-proteobacteria)]|jgi:signal transduction histidine kinase/DNA-binding response OmpR family regulator|uniref:response regulator n=1 Tax=Bosea sp. (in: a-proteobacteria) TaxID=1871050 RepID=UPI002DDD5B97|nr:response regulator [Bosea sp. (in: a-proteobacteria)]HEV2508843.1 response regulator [Bosea sp. (in: a-proteobacteria)]
MIELPSFPILLTGAAIAVAVACAVVAIRLLRERREVTQQARVLTADVEKLSDRLWVLADSEERYRSLIEAQGDLIVRRSEGRIVYANAAYAALIGKSEAEAVGSVEQPRVRSARPVQALPGGARVVDECIETQEGERWLSWVETVVPVAAGQTVLQRVGREISGRIAAETALEEARSRAEEASAAKSRFLATVSHEFRTPLNGILGMADLLGDTRLDPEQATYVKALRSSGEALLGLVDDILDFAKVEAGKLELTDAPFDPVALIEDVTELMAPRAQAKGIEISTLLGPELPGRLLGDAERLRQILLNLVGNAVKFTQAGGVGIEADAVAGQFVVAIADTGPGIPAERLATIFEEFEQGGMTGHRDQAGTGLGLAIARRIARAMGGDIEASNRADGGALFRLALPLRVDTAEAARPASPAWQGRRILIASSAPFSAGHIAVCLERTGAEVLRAADHAQALAMLAGDSALSAVLVDRNLPGGEVEAVAAAARHAGVADIVILLAPAERRSFGSPYAAGFTGFLVKPVRARSLQVRLDPVGRSQGGDGAVPAADASTEKPAAGLRVLVAEDNEINALLLTRTLERLGCIAVWAHDGGEAVRLAEEARSGRSAGFDLALLDVRMPVLDGLGVARRIRAAEKAQGHARLPIVAVSANTAEEDRREALAAGMDDCLAKPLSREQLRGWIERLSQLRTEQMLSA